MPKHDFFSPKSIANRQKSRGLQKLRWYCEMCQKQCRDENGFKCHAMSEAHQRQLLLVAENPNKFVGNFSQQFLESFISLLRRSKGTKRVQANAFYQEYISDKQHLHMNATRWVTLSGFCKYLGENGYCEVEETPRGIFIQYIDRDPEEIARQKRIEAAEAAELDEEQRNAQMIEEQIRRDREALAARGADPDAAAAPAATELVRDPDMKIAFGLQPHAPAPATDAADGAGGADAEDGSAATEATAAPAPRVDFRQLLAAAAPGDDGAAGDGRGVKRKVSALEAIRAEGEQRKMARMEKDEAAARATRKDYWLFEGIVVKVMNKSLADGRFYKQKGVVKEVFERYGAKVKMSDGGAVLRIDQEDLETVIPAVGGAVLVVNGPHRGYEGTLQALDVDAYACTVRLTQGPNAGRDISGIAYEDVCKLAA